MLSCTLKCFHIIHIICYKNTHYTIPIQTHNILQLQTYCVTNSYESELEQKKTYRKDMEIETLFQNVCPLEMFFVLFSYIYSIDRDRDDLLEWVLIVFSFNRLVKLNFFFGVQLERSLTAKKIKSFQ